MTGFLIGLLIGGVMGVFIMGLCATAKRGDQGMKEMMRRLEGEAEGIQGVCGKVLWKKNKDSEKTEWEAVARALNPPADLIAQHTIVKPGPRRRNRSEPKN